MAIKIILLTNISLNNIDATSIITAIVGYVIVFAVLIFMFLIYRFMPVVLNHRNRQRMRRKGKKECEVCLDMTGEINAAISMALYLYFEELHDEESDVVTIKKVSKRYSPWSSKIYGLNQYFN
jgi:Na+-transporting methylmalonyl-CoA/oxaloacetate decarboxylase gamma subunit